MISREVTDSSLNPYEVTAGVEIGCVRITPVRLCGFINSSLPNSILNKHDNTDIR
jgi:hypothetical protein